MCTNCTAKPPVVDFHAILKDLKLKPIDLDFNPPLPSIKVTKDLVFNDFYFEPSIVRRSRYDFITSNPSL